MSIAANLVVQLGIEGLRDVTGGLGQADNAVQGFGSRAASVLGGVVVAGAAAAVAGVAALGVSSVDAAATFEQSLSSIKAVSGATAAEMEAISALSLQLGADTAFSAQEAAAGFEELIKGGLSIADAMAAANPMLNLAAAGGVEVAAAAEIAANALGIFSLKGSDMENVANQIAGAANASSLSVTDFQFSMAAAGSVAAGVGQSFDDLATAIAVMGKSGIKGSDAGTSLKTMLMNLQPSTKAQIATFKELGITAFDAQKGLDWLATQGVDTTKIALTDAEDAVQNFLTSTGKLKGTPEEQAKQWGAFTDALELTTNQFINADGSFKSMSEIAEILQTQLGHLTEAQRAQALETMFGSDAIRAANIFFKEGAEGFQSMTDAMGNVTAADVAATRMDNLKGAVDAMKGSFETFQIVIGTQLLPILTTLVQDYITPAINAAMTFAQAFFDSGDKIGFLITQIDALIPGFATFVAVVTTVAGFIQDNLAAVLSALAAMLIAVVVPAFTAWAATASAAAVATIAALAPVVLPIAAIGAAVGLLVAAWDRDWGGIRTTLTAFWETTGRPIFDTVREWLEVKLTKAIGDFQRGWDIAWPAIKTTVETVYGWITGTLIPGIETAFNNLKQWMTDVKTRWDSDIAAIRGFVETIQTTWDTVTAAVSTAIELIKGYVSSMRDTISTKIEEAVAFFTALPGKITTAVSSLPGLLVQAGTDLIQGLIDGISSIDVGSVLSGIVSGAVDAAKAAMGIKSPSKVTQMEIGRPIIDGIVLGLQDRFPILNRILGDGLHNALAAGLGVVELDGARIVDAMNRMVDGVANAAGRMKDTYYGGVVSWEKWDTTGQEGTGYGVPYDPHRLPPPGYVDPRPNTMPHDPGRDERAKPANDMSAKTTNMITLNFNGPANKNNVLDALRAAGLA